MGRVLELLRVIADLVLAWTGGLELEMDIANTIFRLRDWWTIGRVLPVLLFLILLA